MKKEIPITCRHGSHVMDYIQTDNSTITVHTSPKRVLVMDKVFVACSDCGDSHTMTLCSFVVEEV